MSYAAAWQKKLWPAMLFRRLSAVERTDNEFLARSSIWQDILQRAESQISGRGPQIRTQITLERCSACLRSNPALQCTITFIHHVAALIEVCSTCAQVEYSDF